MATRKRTKKRRLRRSCRNYGGKKRLSPEDALLAESGKEQLHLILMVMCVFLYKNYVAGANNKKRLYPEEINEVVKLLENIRNQHVGVLNRFFGDKDIFNESVMDEKRRKNFQALFEPNAEDGTVKDPTSNASEFLKTCQETECSVAFPTLPDKVPALSGELLKQVSLKIRLVVFLEDMISMLDDKYVNLLTSSGSKDPEFQAFVAKINKNYAVKTPEAKAFFKVLKNEYAKNVAFPTETEQTKGKVIETKLRMWNAIDGTAKTMQSIGYGLGTTAVAFGNAISQLFGRYTPRKTACLKGGEIRNVEFKKALASVTTRVGSFFSKPDPDMREKYAFLFYFKIVSQLYEDNAAGMFDFNPTLPKRQRAENLATTIYEIFAFVHRSSIKNPFASLILFGTVFVCQIFTIAALGTPLDSPLWATANLLTLQEKINPFFLLPFIDNPLMPIFRKEDIEKYNRILAHQAGETLDIRKIASVAENHGRLAASILSQPLEIKFGDEQRGLPLEYLDKEPDVAVAEPITETETN